MFLFFELYAIEPDMRRPIGCKKKCFPMETVDSSLSPNGAFC